MDERHHLSHDEYVESVRLGLARALSAVREGKISSLVAVRQMIGKLRSLSEIEEDASLLLLIGVDSESDHLPLGAERQYWAADSLKDKDEAAARYELNVRDKVISAFEQLAARLNPSTPQLRAKS